MLLILNYLATFLFIGGINASRKLTGLGLSILDFSRFDGLALILKLFSKTLPTAVSILINASNIEAIFSSIFLERLYIFSSTLSSVIK